MVEVVGIWLLVVVVLDQSEFLAQGQGDSFPGDAEQRGRASTRRDDKTFVAVYGG